MNDFAFKILIAICLGLLPALGFSQICNGSLGDPVVNIDFGSGPNPGPPLQNSLPNLSYKASGCPDDGFYTIANSSGDCFGNTWHNYNADHTPNDVNGYMMIINASFSSGDFYVDTVKGLCGGTTYEFAAWITNIFKSNPGCAITVKPTIQFSIETTTGTVLATYIAGNIPETAQPTWQQHGIFFTTPANASSVVLRIANKAPGGCGNDLAIDDISFRPCGPTVSLTAVGLTSPTVYQCIDNLKPVLLEAKLSTGYTNPNILWQKSIDSGKSWVDISPTGAPSQFTYTPTAVGSTQIRVTVAEGSNINIKQCRISSKEVTIEVRDLPGKNASITSPVCEGSLVKLQAGNGNSFSWTGPNGFQSTRQSPSFIATKASAGTYNVQVSDSVGCKSSQSLVLAVLESPILTLEDSIHTCENQPVTINASGGIQYSWQPATGLSATDIANPIATITNNQVYEVVANNINNCFDTATIKLLVDKSPVADAGPDKNLFEGQSTTLAGKAEGSNISWEWFPTVNIDNSLSLTPIVSPTEDIIYTLRVTSTNGCPEASDQVFVRVFKKIVVPNAFSPNADGINDTWRIEALITYPDALIDVYDRYGQLVFHSKGYNNEWDGTVRGIPVPVGMYYYNIDTRTVNTPLRGSVLIIR